MTTTTMDSYDGRQLDALVIGAGPAGTTYGAALAALGLDVVIVEGRKFPREHIGESLLSVSMPILDSLGVMPAIRAKGYPVKRGAVFAWGPDRAEIKLDMAEPGFSFQVQRDEFDLLLLEHAIDAGASVWQEHWVKEPLWRDGRMAGAVVAPAGEPDAKRNVHARLVVDASGLFQYLPRKLGLDIDVFGPRRAAITSYVTGAGRHAQPYRDDIISEASRDGWLWFIPLSEELTSVGFVGDETDLTNAPADFLREQIDSAPLVRELVRGSETVRKARVLKYTNHQVRSTLWKDGYLLIGDTAIFVDPLFSTGVHGALYSAHIAAAATSSWLSGQLPEPEVAKWYDVRFREHYGRVQSAIHLLYGLNPGDSRFWRTRDCMDMGAEEARDLVRKVGAAGMDFFQRNHSSGALPLPPEVARNLDGVRTRMRPVRVPGQTVLEAVPGVELKTDLKVDKGRLAPSVVLKDQESRTLELEIGEDSDVHRLLQHVDGKRDLDEIFSEHPFTIPRQKLELLAGSLVDGGFLRRADSREPTNAGRVSGERSELSCSS